MKIAFLKNKWGFNHATVSSITRKNLVCDMESCDKKIAKIPNVTLTFKNLQKNFEKRKKSRKNSYGFWKNK